SPCSRRLRARARLSASGGAAAAMGTAHRRRSKVSLTGIAVLYSPRIRGCATFRPRPWDSASFSSRSPSLPAPSPPSPWTRSSSGACRPSRRGGWARRNAGGGDRAVPGAPRAGPRRSRVRLPARPCLPASVRVGDAAPARHRSGLGAHLPGPRPQLPRAGPRRPRPARLRARGAGRPEAAGDPPRPRADPSGAEELRRSAQGDRPGAGPRPRERGRPGAETEARGRGGPVSRATYAVLAASLAVLGALAASAQEPPRPEGTVVPLDARD